VENTKPDPEPETTETPTEETTNAHLESAAEPAEAELASSDSELPEWEPLTPELVEEEAIRGDFMLRWAAILLAVLLGWTQIADTPVLVKIRTGQYLAANGWLPPAHDVFSSTAGDQPWVNLAWLGDLILAGVFAVGNVKGISVFTALEAGAAAYFMVHASRMDTSTWWGSACATLALIAAAPLLRAGDDVVTFLGLSLLMFQLASLEQSPSSSFIWRIAPLMFLWSSLDSHAFLGLAMLLAYAIGTWIGGEREQADAKTGRLWVVLGASCVAMLLHPFHWHVLESPWYAYGIEYPARADYGGFDASVLFLWNPLTEPQFWSGLNIHTVAALLIAGISLVTLVLNRRQLRWSHVLVWLTATTLAVFATRQLIAMSVVHAVLAGLNGQDWYRANFRQTYSVDMSELVFSRGGRAVTVIGLFLLGYLAVSGRLLGADARRIGFGFDPRLAAMIESLEDVLEDSFDERPFNFRIEQGDVLIWIGQKPFIDSRVVLFANSEPDLVELHRQLRPAFQEPSPDEQDAGRSQLWQDAFTNYEITHVLPRLTGTNPDYGTFFDLMTDAQQRWKLTRLGAASGVFYWDTSEEGPLREYLDAGPSVDFRELAFAEADDDELEATSQPIWPQPKTMYDRLLMLPRPNASSDIQLARHYNEIPARFGPGAPSDLRAMLALLAIRHAHRGLMNDPDAADGYRQLAVAYSSLYQVEVQLQQTFGGVTATDLRIEQWLAALSNTLICDPDDAYAHLQLYEGLMATQKPDLALDHLREFIRLNDEAAADGSENAISPEQAAQLDTIVADLSLQIDEARGDLDSQLQLGTSRYAIAQTAFQQGLPGEALRILEEDQTVVASDRDAQLMYGTLLLSAGRLEEAYNAIGRLREPIRETGRQGVSRWRYLFGIVNAVSGDYRTAAEQWSAETRDLTDNQLRSVMGMSLAPGTPDMNSAPLTSGPKELVDVRPMTRAAAIANLLTNYSEPWALAQYHEALILMEQGRCERAQELLQELLDTEPESSVRAGAAFYLTAMTGEAIDIVSPAQRKRFESAVPPPPPSAVRPSSDEE